MKSIVYETCLYCGAAVEPGTMGYHYAGFQQPACPDVRMGLDPDWWPAHTERQVLSDEVRAQRKAGGVRRRRQILRQRETLSAGRRRRAEIAHEGMRL